MQEPKELLTRELEYTERQAENEKTKLLVCEKETQEVKEKISKYTQHINKLKDVIKKIGE